MTFVDSVPKEQVARYWSLLDVSIIHLRKTELFTTVIPSKLFECMGMGLPVVHGVAGESADIVLDERVGIVFEPENAGALVQHLRLLQQDRCTYQRYRGRCLEAAINHDNGVGGEDAAGAYAVGAMTGFGMSEAGGLAGRVRRAPAHGEESDGIGGQMPGLHYVDPQGIWTVHLLGVGYQGGHHQFRGGYRGNHGDGGALPDPM